MERTFKGEILQRFTKKQELKTPNTDHIKLKKSWHFYTQTKMKNLHNPKIIIYKMRKKKSNLLFSGMQEFFCTSQVFFRLPYPFRKAASNPKAQLNPALSLSLSRIPVLSFFLSLFLFLADPILLYKYIQTRHLLFGFKSLANCLFHVGMYS